MSSNRDLFVRTLRKARDAASEALDLQRYQCYDKAFLQLTTDIIAEAEIIIAHTNDEEVKDTVKQSQAVAETVRRHYCTETGSALALMSLIEDRVSDVPPETIEALEIYTELLRRLRAAKLCFQGLLYTIASTILEKEIAQFQEEIPCLHRAAGLVKGGRQVPQTKEPSECLQDQRQESGQRQRQINARMAEIKAALRHPDAFIKLMLY